MAIMRDTKESPNRLLEKIMGDKASFAMENRLFNLGCIIALGVSLMFLIINVIGGFWLSFWLCLVILLSECFFYYQARFKQKYRFTAVANALLSYVIITANYFINSGIKGPSVLLFLFAFILFIASMPLRTHFYWLALHVVLGCGLIIYDINNPGAIPDYYSGAAARFFDVLLTTLIAVVFIYIITHSLRNYYLLEKAKAEASKIKLKAFFESTGNCYMLLNSSRKIIYFNKAAAAFIKSTLNKDVHEGADAALFVGPQYLEKFDEHYRNALQGTPRTEERLMYFDGLGSMWLQLYYAPVINSQGVITGVSFSCINITKRKEHAEKIRQQNIELTKIAFLQSHELRQPVSSILGLLNLMQDDSVNTGEYQEYLQSAVDELDTRLGSIITSRAMPFAAPRLS